MARVFSSAAGVVWGQELPEAPCVCLILTPPRVLLWANTIPHHRTVIKVVGGEKGRRVLHVVCFWMRDGESFESKTFQGSFPALPHSGCVYATCRFPPFSPLLFPLNYNVFPFTGLEADGSLHPSCGVFTPSLFPPPPSFLRNVRESALRTYASSPSGERSGRKLTHARTSFPQN